MMTKRERDEAQDRIIRQMADSENEARRTRGAGRRHETPAVVPERSSDADAKARNEDQSAGNAAIARPAGPNPAASPTTSELPANPKLGVAEDVRPDVEGLLREVDSALHGAFSLPDRSVLNRLLTRCRAMIESLAGERDRLADEVARQGSKLRVMLGEDVCNGFIVHDPETTYRYEPECVRWKRELAESERARDADWADAERLRHFVDNNMTFYDVDADYDVEGHNIPTLAQVSKRIWYHATDDITSYPFSAVIDAAREVDRG